MACPDFVMLTTRNATRATESGAEAVGNRQVVLRREFPRHIDWCPIGRAVKIVPGDGAWQSMKSPEKDRVNPHAEHSYIPVVPVQ
jgi:hypothetical protein